MSLRQKLKYELKALTLAVAFFGAWIGVLILLKTLVLEEYRIGFAGWSKVLVGALILSKVVLMLEHLSLGAWVRGRPAWVDTLLRTALYSAGVAVVLLVEHGIRERHQTGGFAPAVLSGLRQVEVPHVLVNTICLSGALLVYNASAVVRRHLGPGGLLQLFLKPMPEEPQAKQRGTSAKSP